MRRSLILGVAIAAFIAVDFTAIQTSDAQRLRRIFPRNRNNCATGCCDCVPTGSGMIVGESSGTVIETGAMEAPPMVSEGTFVPNEVISDGYVSNEFVSEPTIAPAAPTVFEPPIQQGAIVDSGMVNSGGGFPVAEMGVDAYSGPAECQNGCPGMETPAMNSGFAFDTGISSVPIDTGISMPVENAISTMPSAAPIVSTSTSAPSVAEAIQRNRMAIDNSVGVLASDSSVPMGIVDEGLSVIPASTPISESPIVDAGYVDSGFVGGEFIQTGMTDGNIIDGGSVIGGVGEVMGCATGDCGGQIVEGEIVGGDFGEQIISSGDATGQVLSSGETFSYDAPQEFSQGSPVEQVISSEIVSETPIDATASEDSVTVESPSQAPDAEMPAEAPTSEAPKKSDSVPEAPPRVNADDKEA